MQLDHLEQYSSSRDRLTVVSFAGRGRVANVVEIGEQRAPSM
jgi:hypothetical protein